MNKLALNFICKDESHIIEKMLKSTLPIIDLIVANDTGSTDGTQEIIKKFGKENNIPTYVLERPFDNFENSRNYAMDNLIKITKELKWDLDKSYGFWIDCDETIADVDKFNKDSLSKDLYMINAQINNTIYTRNTFFKLSKKFEWYGPVHEFIRPLFKNITTGVINGMYIDVKMDGNSWKGSIADKYKKHAFLLEEYIDKDRSDSRWVFYTAQSYYDSSCTKSKSENEERLRRALNYYKERIDRKDGHEEEIYFSQYRIGIIMNKLDESWNLTHQEFLKAYTIDPLRGESIKAIIDYYLRTKQWHNAYLYSKFSLENFHNKSPYPKRILFLNEKLYSWKILEVHSIISYYTGRIEESKKCYKKLLSLINEKPNLFSIDDINKIKSNKKYLLNEK